jgi:hypothetical protein
MKTGDKVHFHVASNTVTGKILEVDGDTVKGQ